MSTEELVKRLTRLEQSLDNHEKRITILEGKGTKANKKRRAISLPEFIKGRKAKSHRDRAIWIAYYLENYAGKDSFRVEDMNKEYRDCGYHLPANMSDVLKKAYAQGFLVRIGKEKGVLKWALSTTGIEIVEKETSKYDDTLKK